jgi:hypothetical protein
MEENMRNKQEGWERNTGERRGGGKDMKGIIDGGKGLRYENTK